VEKLQRWWQSHYAKQTLSFMPPLGHILRAEFPDQWLRVHSLPDSKRYADTPNEYSTLLTRQNAVATTVLETGGKCLLFVGRLEGHPQWQSERQTLPGLKETTFALFQSVSDEDEPAQMAMNFWCAPVRWHPERYDELIRAVADDEEDYIVFASLQTSEIYAPYDGGADLILSSSLRRNELKQKFEAWLSHYPLEL
jgi:hypothetical protein